MYYTSSTISRGTRCVAFTKSVGHPPEGNRVAKGTLSSFSCGATFTPKSTYIIGPSGEQLTETDGSGNWVHTNVYAAGQYIATYENDTNSDSNVLHFVLTDWLGTKRVQTNYAGVSEEVCTSLAFGDGLSCSYPTGHPSTADDASEIHFTGKERDAETGFANGNDYFGARYYGSSMGRFMSPDPSQLVYADQTNPQSLNLYSYVRNNPQVNTDPTGMECVWDDGSYDDQHDPDTGNDVDMNGHDVSGSGKKKCDAKGGRWVDHSFFENANKNGANLPDWSPDPNPSTSPTAPLGLVNLLSACTETILDAVNAQFASTGMDLTTDNVTDNFWYNGAVNINISATNLSAAQYKAIHDGRYMNLDGKETSPSLHLPKGPGGADSLQTLPFSKQNGSVSTTAHIDTALAGILHPVGTAIHVSTDVRDSGANRTPCP